MLLFAAAEGEVAAALQRAPSPRLRHSCTRPFPSPCFWGRFRSPLKQRQKRRFAPEQHLRIALPGGVVEKLLSNQGLAHAAGSSSVSCVDVAAIFGTKRDEGLRLY